MRRLILSVAIAGVLGWVASTAAPGQGDSARAGAAKPKPDTPALTLVARP